MGFNRSTIVGTDADGYQYDSNGNRRTQCCGAVATIDEDGVPFCKACFNEVSFDSIAPPRVK